MSKKEDDENAVSLAQLVKSMRENLPAHLEFAELNAKIMRRKYLSLVDEGFTSSQAIDLLRPTA